MANRARAVVTTVFIVFSRVVKTGKLGCLHILGNTYTRIARLGKKTFPKTRFFLRTATVTKCKVLPANEVVRNPQTVPGIEPQRHRDTEKKKEEINPSYLFQTI